MSQFKDKTGYEWTLDLNLQKAWEIEEYDFQRQTPQVKLVPPDDNFFTERITDTKVCFGMVWVMVREEAKEKGINNELEFAKRIDGKSLTGLKVALWTECENFFPEWGITLKALIDRYSAVLQKATIRLADKINEVMSDAEIDKLLDQEMAKMDEARNQVLTNATT